MSQAPIDFATLKRGGVMRQVTPGLFSLRLHVVAGNLDADRLEAVASLARRFGNGTVHLTSRQGIEIPFVKQESIELFRAELPKAGLALGACGPRVRTVTGCQGAAICPHGVVETRELCEAIDRRFAGRELPHKLKFGVSGCRNSCLKPQENDIGIMGVIEPVVDETGCTSCKACVASCEHAAIDESGEFPRVDSAKCLQCGDCIASCPSDSMRPERKGFALILGGRIGRNPRLGERYPGLFATVDELMPVLDALVELYRREGRPSERFGPMLERLPRETVVNVVESARAPAQARRAG